MKLKVKQFFDAATDNSGTGTSKKTEGTEKKEPEDKAELQKKEEWQKKQAEAVAKVITNTKINTEAEVKKSVSKTLVPGGAGDSDNDGKMDSVDYFTDVLVGKI